MNYYDYNDYELISLANEENEDAKNILILKYKPLIQKIVAKLYKYCKNNGLEKSDLIQEGMIGLNHAIETFNQDREILFYTYAYKCIKTRLISTLISCERQKNKILNESISYDRDDSNMLNFIKDTSSNPEDLIINSDKELINRINSNLSENECAVFDLLINGFNYREIANILNKDSKSIDNTIQRIKNKIKIELNKHN